ncbi:MAG: hypothetical protein WC667_13075 [Sulfurimonas sp.]|jgi:hypothetical protein
MKLGYDIVKELTQLMAEARKEIKYKKDTALLDELIKKFEELVNSKSKLADYDELKSDIKWLKEYYDKKSWNDVTRWLTNIDSTLRETFSKYIEAIKNIRGDSKWRSKEKASKNESNDDES